MNIEREEFRTIPNFSNYKVSSEGRVLNIKRNRCLKPYSNKSADKKGYVIIIPVGRDDDFNAVTLRVQLIARELLLLHKTLEEFDQKIAEVFKQHPDREIFRHLPGAGPVLAPRLLASIGSERERFESARNLQSYSGIAPVTKQSGGKCYIHRRYLCPQFIKQSFHEYAKESILHSRWAAAHYWQQRQKGCGHHTAVRSLAYKWNASSGNAGRAAPSIRRNFTKPHSGKTAVPLWHCSTRSKSENHP